MYKFLKLFFVSALACVGLGLFADGQVLDPVKTTILENIQPGSDAYIILVTIECLTGVFFGVWKKDWVKSGVSVMTAIIFTTAVPLILSAYTGG